MLRYSTWFWPLHSKLEVVDVSCNSRLDTRVPMCHTLVVPNSCCKFKFYLQIIQSLHYLISLYHFILATRVIYGFCQCSLLWCRRFGNMSLSYSSFTRQSSWDLVYINLLWGTSQCQSWYKLKLYGPEAMELCKPGKEEKKRCSLCSFFFYITNTTKAFNLYSQYECLCVVYVANLT